MNKVTKMHHIHAWLLYCVCLLTTTLFPISFSQAAQLPETLQAVLLTKFISYEQNIADRKSFSIFIIDNKKLYTAFNQLKESNNQSISISTVEQGQQLPNRKYDLIYINDEKYLSDALEYAKTHQAILTTGKISLVKKGITLGMGTEQGKPKFYLNLSSSFSAKLHWDPKILTVVKTYP